MSKVYAKLSKVQTELKAPKNQRNNFGKYNYRSKEDILEAAKPLCAANGLALVVDDELILVGERYYIKSEAKVICIETGDSVTSKGYAREADVKKGMDESQITGAASSYSGKYALNNLFGIDDTKDADATNTGSGDEKPAVAAKTTTAKPVEKPTAKAAVSTAKPSGKAAVKKAMTEKSKESFLNGISQGKFDLVEKHLADYKVDANSKEVVKFLAEARAAAEKAVKK